MRFARNSFILRNKFFYVLIGIILSGNLISQVLLALILSYAGGQRNRPKWIARSVLLGSISSFLLAVPYFVFGASEESLQLTQEYSSVHNGVSRKKIEFLTKFNSIDFYRFRMQPSMRRLKIKVKICV